MERRQFLGAGIGAAAAGVSGCVDELEAKSSAESPKRTFSLVSVDDDPDPLSFDVEVVSAALSQEELPVFTIAVENTGEQPVTWTYGGSIRELPFPQGIHSRPDSKLVSGLEGEVEAQLREIDDGCARVERFDRDDAEVHVSLEPGDSFDDRRYGIAGVDENLEEGCPPPDTYRVEFEYGNDREWGFEFQLE